MRALLWLKARVGEALMNFRHWLVMRCIAKRHPDFVIGGHERPYLLRWYLIPQNPLMNIYLHEFRRSDDDRALHDHPWLFNLSWLLLGTYTEHTIERGGVHRRTVRNVGDIKLRIGPAPHRIELHDGWCFTLFITGPWYRTWGFHCAERGWVRWKDFVDERDSGAVGPGCGQ